MNGFSILVTTMFSRFHATMHGNTNSVHPLLFCRYCSQGYITDAKPIFKPIILPARVPLAMNVSTLRSSVSFWNPFFPRSTFHSGWTCFLQATVFPWGDEQNRDGGEGGEGGGGGEKRKPLKWGNLGPPARYPHVCRFQGSVDSSACEMQQRYLDIGCCACADGEARV